MHGARGPTWSCMIRSSINFSPLRGIHVLLFIAMFGSEFMSRDFGSLWQLMTALCIVRGSTLPILLYQKVRYPPFGGNPFLNPLAGNVNPSKLMNSPHISLFEVRATTSPELSGHVRRPILHRMTCSSISPSKIHNFTMIWQSIVSRDSFNIIALISLGTSSMS